LFVQRVVVDLYDFEVITHFKTVSFYIVASNHVSSLKSFLKIFKELLAPLLNNCSRKIDI